MERQRGRDNAEQERTNHDWSFDFILHILIFYVKLLTRLTFEARLKFQVEMFNNVGENKETTNLGPLLLVIKIGPSIFSYILNFLL